MSKNQKKLYIVIFSLVALTLVVFFYSYLKEQNVKTGSPASESSIPSPAVDRKVSVEKETSKKSQEVEIGTEAKIKIQSDVAEATESVTIRAGNTQISLNVPPDTLFYEALVQARNQGQILFDGENYPGLGFLVTSIGSLSAGGGKYLLYYINGESANVGVSSYTLKDQDVIEWKLE